MVVTLQSKWSGEPEMLEPIDFDFYFLWSKLLNKQLKAKEIKHIFKKNHGTCIFHIIY